MSRNAGVGVGAVVGVGGRQRGKWKLLTPEKPTSLAKPWGFGGGWLIIHVSSLQGNTATFCLKAMPSPFSKSLTMAYRMPQPPKSLQSCLIATAVPEESGE